MLSGAGDVFRVNNCDDAIRETGGGADTLFLRSSESFDIGRIETLAFNETGAGIRLSLNPAEGGPLHVAFGAERDRPTLMIDRRQGNEAGESAWDVDLAQVGGNDQINFFEPEIERILNPVGPDIRIRPVSSRAPRHPAGGG